MKWIGMQKNKTNRELQCFCNNPLTKRKRVFLLTNAPFSPINLNIDTVGYEYIFSWKGIASVKFVPDLIEKFAEK